MNKNLKHISLSCLLAAFPVFAFGQVVFTTPGGTVTENFNSYDFAAETTNTSVTWTNNSTIANWYADTRATELLYAYGGGVSSTAVVYGYKFDADGNTGSPGSSLGTRSSSSDPWGIGWAIQNNTGSTLTSFSLSYDAFVSNYLGDSGPDGYTVTYQIGGSYQNNGFANEYTSAEYIAPINQTDESGNPVISSTVAGDTLTGLNWGNGEILWIHWQDTSAVSGESTYGMGIDNVSLTAVPEPSTVALGMGLFTLGLILFRRRVARGTNG